MTTHVVTTQLKYICVEFGPGSYVINVVDSMPGTSAQKMLTFSCFAWLYSIQIEALFNKECETLNFSEVWQSYDNITKIELNTNELQSIPHIQYVSPVTQWSSSCPE